MVDTITYADYIAGSDLPEVKGLMQKKLPSQILMKRLLVVCSLVVCVAATVVWLSIDSAHKVSSSADQLISHHIPGLSAISTLQSVMNERVIQLYLYYATMQAESGEQLFW
ncbi:MAG: hypothetical protein V3W04_12135 [Gammaproteobacteria bacterium]